MFLTCILLLTVSSSSISLQTQEIELENDPGNYFWITNKIYPHEKYAVFGANIPAAGTSQHMKYLYNLPIVSLSWNRIGYCIVW